MCDENGSFHALVALYRMTDALLERVLDGGEHLYVRNVICEISEEFLTEDPPTSVRARAWEAQERDKKESEEANGSDRHEDHQHGGRPATCGRKGMRQYWRRYWWRRVRRWRRWREGWRVGAAVATTVI